jgi:hypothetical protein
VATAASTDVGLDAEALIGALWSGLLGPGADEVEPVVEDPMMVRLGTVMEDLAATEASVCVAGPRGSGRRTLLGKLAAAGSRRIVEVSGFAPEAVARALGDPRAWVLVRDADASLDALPSKERARLLVTSRTPLDPFTCYAAKFHCL